VKTDFPLDFVIFLALKEIVCVPISFRLKGLALQLCFLTKSINIEFTGCVLCTSSHSLYVGRSEHFIESVMCMDTVMFEPVLSPPIIKK